MAADRKARLDPVDPASIDRQILEANAFAVIRSLADMQALAGEPAASVDVGLSLEACLLAAAILIESRGPDDADDLVARSGENLKAYVAAFRAQRLGSGRSAIEQLSVGGFGKSRVQ
jgi:hypothetical protein